MIYKMFSIFDTKIQAHMLPMFFKSKGEALRAITDEVNSSNPSMLSKHPQDLVLFYLGEFDDSKADFSLVAPESIAVLIELKDAA